MPTKPPSPPEEKTNVETRPLAEGMFRSSDDVRSSFISGIEAFTVKPVEYSAINGRAIFEGDILLGTVEQLEAIREQLEGPATRERSSISGTAVPADIQFGVGITGQRFRWPDGLVPFTVVAQLRTVVQQAIQHWQQNTRIRFVERTAANAAQFPNWVAFEVQDGCFSSVGMQGNGTQVISLEPAVALDKQSTRSVTRSDCGTSKAGKIGTATCGSIGQISKPAASTISTSTSRMGTTSAATILVRSCITARPHLAATDNRRSSRWVVRRSASGTD